MVAKITPKPPEYLRPETADWFADVLRSYDLEQHHVRLLVMAAEAWDASRDAREAIATHGMTYTDRFNQPHARPEIKIAEASRMQFARLLRELDLDVAAPPETPRPPGLRSNRR